MDDRTARRRLAENLRVRRVLRGWSQEDLAEAAGLHRTYVSAIERAGRNVGLDNLQRLAAAFGISIPDLFTEPDPAAVGLSVIESIRDTLKEK